MAEDLDDLDGPKAARSRRRAASWSSSTSGTHQHAATLGASPLLLAGQQQVPRLVWERVHPLPGAA
jgi:hypothetical protein